jgi:ubiquinone/menaquinone biosynthesis C-methylase UbiE
VKPYGVFAKYYDILMSDVDYEARALYIGEIFHRHGIASNSVLDLACGTGKISVELAKAGFEVIGVDGSAEMLSQAMAKSSGDCDNPVFICQDMRALDLYGTVGAAVCTLDGINHLTSPASVKKTFERVSLFLESGGLFVFDLNSPYKIEEIMGENSYVYDYDEIYCVWQNSYHPENKTCCFDLTFFEQIGDRYIRSDETFSERAYTAAQVEKYLKAAGLELAALYDDMTFEPPHEKSERIIYVARKK